MYYDLPKKGKKIARQLMDKGILTEFEQGLKRFDAIYKTGKQEIAKQRIATISFSLL